MIENDRSLNIAASIILLLGIVYILGPLYLTLTTASISYEQMLRSGISSLPGDQLLNNFIRIFTETQIPRQIYNTIVVAAISSLGICVLSFFTAFALVFFNLRFAGLVFALVLVTIMLPIDVRIVTTYQTAANIFAPVNALLDVSGINGALASVLGAPVRLELSVLDTHIGLALPLLAHGTGTFMFRQFFRTLPADLVKAARMDGAGPLRFMVDILLPLSRTTFLALFILMFLGGWTQYLWPLVASSTPDMRTAVVGLARLAPSEDGRVPDFPLIMAGAILVSIIPLLIIAAMQRYLVRGLVLSEK